MTTTIEAAPVAAAPKVENELTNLPAERSSKLAKGLDRIAYAFAKAGDRAESMHLNVAEKVENGKEKIEDAQERAKTFMRNAGALGLGALIMTGEVSKRATARAVEGAQAVGTKAEAWADRTADTLNDGLDRVAGSLENKFNAIRTSLQERQAAAQTRKQERADARAARKETRQQEREDQRAEKAAERENRRAEAAADALARKQARQDKWAARKASFGLAVSTAVTNVQGAYEATAGAVVDGAIAAAELKRKAGEAVTAARETVSGVVDSATERVKTTTENVAEQARGATERFKANLDNVRAVGTAAIEAAQATRTTLREQQAIEA